MAELFKNIWNNKFFDEFTRSIQKIIPEFNSESFITDIHNKEWSNMEFKQRMRHITIVLNKHLSNDFNKNAETLLRLLPELEKKGFNSDSLPYIFLPDFIEVYGLNDYDTSINAFEKITQFISCEFAVRPFILKFQEPMLKQMNNWSNHKQPMVRRLASEGCRPRLPWAMALPFLKENPEPIIPILEKLKNDSSESVRRSVANNLNDISKDNPQRVIEIVKKWKGNTKETDSLTKHASRTLLKQGNTEVMELFGFGSIKEIELSDFRILTPIVKIEDSLKFTLNITNSSIHSCNIRLEYGLYYQKAAGTLSKKVYKISEKEYPKKSTTTITRKQSFRVITTRRFHTGLHQVSIIINGTEFEKLDFDLIE